MDKLWFITGVSKGLGRQIAVQAAKDGYTVVGTVRTPAQIEEINNIAPGKTFGYLMDVNVHTQVNEVVKEVIDRFGRIDVLVNNAGYGIMGAIEETSIKETRQQMETNFFGALAVTQQVLPHMRKQKSGHIIQISSIAGIESSPGLGIYNASKFALEGFSEALKMEVEPLGIKVTIVEPGAFRTEWAGKSMKFAEKTIQDYEPTAGRVKKIITQNNGNQPGDPEKAAIAILRITEINHPPLRLPLGRDAIHGIQKKLEIVRKDAMEWEQIANNTEFNR